MSGTRHLEFAPPATPGMVRAVLMALVAHLALVAVLAIGVAWKRETPPVAVEAELWAAVPQEAAPLPPEPEPEPPEPEPEPPLPVRPAPPPAPPVVDTPKAADIALAKEKEKARLQKAKELQQAKLEQERKAQQDKLQREKLTQEKQRKEQETKVAREKAEKDKAKTADTAKQKAALAKAEAQKLEEMRQQNLKRMAGLAGAPTGSGGTGTAEKSSGNSSGYGAKIAASIKRRMVYSQTVVGNPKVEIEVSALSDGTITSKKISKSSGTPAWDEAVLNALEKLGTLPRDTNGRVPSPMIISYSADDMIGP
jgi:colicin import membrane protein